MSRTAEWQKFTSVFNTSNFVLNTAALPVGIYSTLLRYTVRAQQKSTFGHGAIVGGVDARGILFMEIRDVATGNPIREGMLRFTLADANLVNRVVVKEVRTEQIRATRTDRNNAFFMGEFFGKAREDSILLVEFMPDVATTTAAAQCLTQIPITHWFRR